MHDEILILRMDKEKKSITPRELDNSIQEVINKHQSRPDKIVITKYQHYLLSKQVSDYFQDDDVTRSVVSIGLRNKPKTWRGLELDIKDN